MSQIIESLIGRAVQPLAGATQTRAESLAANVEAAIGDNDLAPGSYVATLDELRDSTGFARATVSEAVRLLRERGVVAIRPGRGGGIFVAESNPVIRLRHTLLTVRDSPSLVLDAIAVRGALEGLITGDAARHRGAADIAALKKALTKMRRAKDHDAFMHSNWALHERIAEISPNAMAKAVYTGTLGYIKPASAEFDSTEEDRVDYLEHRYRVHEALVQAIIDGDSEAAARAVHEHENGSGS
ncbi:FCD domain-containing protein [Leifsonia kafniensis]|uniref:FCD domain-containing protein n=1 Tax=Leifsonia kafniensis TaxID=475957 RepID=A0ABP7KPA3_9MICO